MTDRDQTNAIKTKSLILREVDQILNSLQARDASQPDWMTQHFSRCYKRYEEMTDQMPKLAERLGSLVAANLSQSKPFSICSLACGDGEMDYLILSKVAKNFPDANIHWTGIDINPVLCEQAQEKLNGLPFKIELRCEDIDKINPAQMPKFEFISMIHGHYYFPLLGKSISRILELKHQDTLLIFVSAPQADYNQLYRRFWRYENGREFWHSEFLLPELKQRSFNLEVEMIHATMDISQCFQEGWDARFSQEVVDYLCHAALDEFPSRLRELAIAYLEVIVIHKHNRWVLEHPCHLITVR